MKNNKLWMIIVAVLLAVVVVGCSSPSESGESSEAIIAELGGESSNEAGGEHSADGGEEGSGANALALNETFDTVRAGARLILKYDAGNNAFVGTVENTTTATLTRVRIEVHLSNGTELGPTTPTDLVAGEIMDVVMPATDEAFDSWVPHAEVGSGEGGESSGGESGEAEMSSPITPLGDSWEGVLGGLAVSMQYDATTKSVYGTVENISTQQLCYVQAEPHLKSGTRTVGELGPEKLGALNPGQQVNSSLSVDSEANLTGVVFDGYVIHMEVFDCSGTGPIPHTGGEGFEGGSEGSGEHGEGGEGGGG